MKIYTSLEALGVSALSTPNEILTAMKPGSIFVINNSALTSGEWNFPNTLSTLYILKQLAGRAIIQLFGKGVTNNDYRMYLENDNTPTGQWMKNLTNSDLPMTGKIYQLGAGAKVLFDYSGGNQACIVYAMRGAKIGIYMFDNWNAKATINDYPELAITVSNKVVTMQNNDTVSISIIVLIADSMPLIT